MRCFWMEGRDLPAGIGFGLWTGRHFAALGLCAAGIAGYCLWFLHSTKGQRRRIQKGTALALLAGNLLRDLFLFSIGRMSVAYLPLHLCSFAIFVYLLQAFLPKRCSNLAGALGEIGAVLLLPGTVCALIFPDWTAYPLWNFMCIHSFLWHAVLVAYPLSLLLSGQVRPTIRHLWYPVVFLVLLVPPIALFNALTGCNYLFIMRPVPGTPLELLQEFLGGYWRVGYAVLVFAVLLLEYFVWEILRHFFPLLKGEIPS